MVTNYENKARLLRHVAKRAGYKISRRRGWKDWWCLTACRSGTTYQRFEALTIVLFDALTPAPTIH
jgi:hypothetical protein